ncbi:putative neutral sphingomyelinase isoform X2 [Eurytemora carolleeae]|uniref:putative neutral sphingomyelinase isoform X2 n=1 Tax=Eurytemora carolleeae TaxID=1294199 RepID=UPI000C757060|nr:putative neutral sphingomyelinase isoform X2 [Eurytemora carolleeae]|eukprot:XP_023338359.1 putative neutral sphingomyelinase isoform X2 [Eurytemora affinis]
MEISIFNLNCWGLPSNTPILNSKFKEERIAAIIRFIIAEVWLKSDYQKMKEAWCKNLPHSVYFKKGLLGSGTCIFSKYALSFPAFHEYTVNGFIHQVWFGDAWATAGIGTVQTQINEQLITLAVTHFHAEYDTKQEPFLVDRAVQALEASEILKNCAEFVILAGDFNSEPGSIPISILSQHLTDSRGLGLHSPTWSHPSNSFKDPSEAPLCLDYVFYSSSLSLRAVESRCTDPLPYRIPGKHFSYSDHQAVLAQITVAPSIDNNYSKIEKNKCTESNPQPESNLQPESKQQTESKPQPESKQQTESEQQPESKQLLDSKPQPESKQLQTESEQQPESKQLLDSKQQHESKELSELKHFTNSELNSAVQNLLLTSVTFHEQEISNTKQIMAVSFLFLLYHLVKLINQDLITVLVLIPVLSVTVLFPPDHLNYRFFIKILLDLIGSQLPFYHELSLVVSALLLLGLGGYYLPVLVRRSTRMKAWIGNPIISNPNLPNPRL